MLTFLKYTGLILAALSAVWGMTRDTTTTVHKKKHLTPAGYIAIGFTMLGVAINICSNALEDRQRAAAAALQIKNILSSQPVESMHMTWDFRGLPESLLKGLRAGIAAEDKFEYHSVQRNLTGEETRALNRWFGVYPFLTGLARGLRGTVSPKGQPAMSDSNVLILIAMDDAQNSVLAMGKFNLPFTWAGQKPAADKVGALPAGITVCADIDYIALFGICEPPYAKGVQPAGNLPWLQSADGQGGLSLKSDVRDMTVDWQLDPKTLAGTVITQNPSLGLRARLPDVLRIAMFSDFTDLKFETANFSIQPQGSHIWEDTVDADELPTDAATEKHLASAKKGWASDIAITINNDSNIDYKYELDDIYVGRGIDPFGEFLISECIVFEYKLTGAPWISSANGQSKRA